MAASYATGAADGASEHITVLSRTAASPSGGYAADGASEHFTLLSRTEAKDYKKDAGGHGRKNARAILQKVIAGQRSVEFNADGTSFYLDTDEKIGASEHIGI